VIEIAHFELFGRLKKKPSVPGHPPAQNSSVSSPAAIAHSLVPKILQMADSGMAEGEIVSHLKAEGYAFEEIDAALAEALKSGVSGRPPQAETFHPPQPELHAPSLQQQILPPHQLTQDEIIEKKFEEIEEITEALVDEKMEKIMQKVVLNKDIMNALKEKLEALTKAVTSTQETITSIKKQMEENRNETEAKFTEIDPRMNSLEKAFRDVVPSIVDSIRELKEIVHGHIDSSVPMNETKEQKFDEYHR
jgi:DNA-binding transcriptional MerR regulator